MSTKTTSKLPNDVRDILKTGKMPKANGQKDTLAQVQEKLVAQFNDKAPTNRDVKRVLDAYSSVLLEQLATRGTFVIPRVVKVFTRYKPAQPKRQMLLPGKTEKSWVPAKPASLKTTARPLKNAKDSTETFASGSLKMLKSAAKK